MVRVFCTVPDPAPPKLRLGGERFHYLARVLRLKAGDPLEVFDGKGRAFAARLASVGSAELEVELKAVLLLQLRPEITLIQGLPKGERLDWLLQKGTELGMTAFAAVAMHHCVAKIRPPQIEERRRRWQKIAEEAARQSGRADVPTILPYQPLLEAIRALAPATRMLVLNEREREVRLSQALATIGDSSGPVALVAGPEGGIHPLEMEQLLGAGGVSVSLGNHVLRAETAPLAALAVLLHSLGELG